MKDWNATAEELEALVEKARVALDEAVYEKLMAAIRTLGYVTALLEDQRTSVQSLRNLLCAKQTEKTADVLKRAGIEEKKRQQRLSRRRPGTVVMVRKPIEERRGFMFRMHR